MKIISGSPQDTLKIGRAVARSLKPGDIVCLFGKLGSGKTVLAKGIAEGLGIKKEQVISPSFVLLRQYAGRKINLYHFDLYRLSLCRQILGLGYEEYFYGDGVTLIEWADRLNSLLPKEYLKVKFSIRPGTKRLLEFNGIGRRYQGLAKEIHEDISVRYHH